MRVCFMIPEMLEGRWADGWERERGELFLFFSDSTRYPVSFLLIMDGG